jgi:hypothetical protein
MKDGHCTSGGSTPDWRISTKTSNSNNHKTLKLHMLVFGLNATAPHRHIHSLLQFSYGGAEKNREPEMPWGDERNEREYLRLAFLSLEKGSRKQKQKSTNNKYPPCNQSGYLLFASIGSK